MFGVELPYLQGMVGEWRKKKKGLDYSSWKTKNGNSVSSQNRPCIVSVGQWE